MHLQHPHHTANFTAEGHRFSPTNGGPDWHWQLTHVGIAGMPWAEVELGPLTPIHAPPRVVQYPRGGLVEQYLARANGVEQQFVIPQPPVPAGSDLVIEGEDVNYVVNSQYR